ncbi:hypothetical protein BofuT4_P073440.1 [Botrytis cinerea T4]|uniref:Uncharacterized protein n=1 Tax=Botryotinia fuckeliana (strain T4) TaxID=999810 RepID=G2XPC6_BOTF4|nr:hypothetical protein BofuT4_P073440.1 [Botrytis cinerea T4]
MYLCLFWLKCKCKIVRQDQNGSRNQHDLDDRISQSESASHSTRLKGVEKKNYNTMRHLHSRNSNEQKHPNNVTQRTDSGHRKEWWCENISYTKTEKNEDCQDYERLKKEHRLVNRRKDGR